MTFERSERFKNLSSAKRALLLNTLRKNQKQPSSTQRISRSGLREAPLSFAQQRMWFLSQLEVDHHFYNVPLGMRLRGPLRAEVLERCLTEIVRRHEALRTIFPTRAGVPVQVVVPPIACVLPVIDLSDLPKAEQEKYLKQLSKAEAQRSFDLARGPIFRLKLLRLASEEHILLLTMHHIVSDGWSTGIIRRELIQLYHAFYHGWPSPLPELPIQYIDFALWQHQALRGEKFQEHLTYWQKQLAGIPRVIELPTDFPRPALQSYRGKREPLLLPQELVHLLKSFSQGTGVTLFMVLLAAFQILLFRYSGQRDIVVGTPVASRTPAEVENLIGFFSNTLVLRGTLSGTTSFKELLKQTKNSALEAYAHQEVPFERLVEILQPERSLSHAPLFQVMFTLQTAVTVTEKLAELEVIDWEGEAEVSRFDLTFFLEESPDGLTGYAEYSTDLFRAETIRRFISHWRQLLAGIVANPDESIATLPLLSDEERRQILVTWNTSTEAPPQEYAQCLFERQVERSPEAVALVWADTCLTYAELNRRANALAHSLRAKGVGPEVRVGLCMERSLELVIGLLGIMKAGGAYLPLDPSYPPDRLTYMLLDANAPFVLIRADFRPRLPAGLQATVLLLDAECIALSSEQEKNPACMVTADNLAYMTYTSGSTGKPKGVMVPHRGLSNLAISQIRAFQVDAQCRVFQFAAFSFDAFISEVLMALLSGAVLDLGDEQVQRVGDNLLALLRARTITTITLPPSILATLPCEASLNLKTLIVAGEACSAEIVALWSRLAHVHNAYGPTEATVCATIARNCDGSRKPPIGFPIAHVQVYILDSWLQPVPVGVPGEIYIGGIGLARGYHNNAALTAECFLPHPFSTEPGARLYKTGDRARYLANGEIEFLGRFDTQVKLHGFRIELQEIETVLNECPGVQDCAVVLREDIPGDARLVAYVVPGDRDQEALTTMSHTIRYYLQQRLPAYMIPSAIVRLETLPLNVHGKVDRRALPIPDRALLLTTSSYVAPRTAIEHILARIWENVLRIERVSVTDNFFTLGGDSILSVQVVARASQQGLHFLPKQLFQYQTIEALSTIVEKSTPRYAQQGPVVGDVPLTPVQHWFLALSVPKRDHWNQALLLEVPSQIEAKYLEQALAAILAHHDALRLRLRRQAGDWRQFCAEPGEAVDLHWIDFSSLQSAEQVSALAAAEAELQASLHLATGPLVRAVLFAFGKQQPALLLLIIHHMAVDSISWGILLEDLQTAYQDCTQGRAIRLPLKTTSLQQWAERLTAYAQSKQLQQEREYWLGVVGSSRAALPLDKDAEWQENRESSARRISLPFSVDETQQLLTILPSRYRVRPHEVLLTALARTLCSWAHTSSLVIDLEGHGRESPFVDIDLSRTVGWFTTLYPVRLAVKPASSLLDALQDVHQYLQDLPNQGIGYGILRYLSEESALSALPPSEVVFNYLGHLNSTLPPQGILQAIRPVHGPLHDPQGRRPYLLEIEGYVSEEKLQIDWIYSCSFHRDTTIERLGETFTEILRALIAESQARAGSAYSPADFPDVDLSQETLEQLLEEIDFT